MELSLLFIVLTVCVVVALSKVFSLSRNIAPLPPGPAPLPIIGNLLDLRDGQPHHSLTHLAKVHGPIMSLKLGLKTIVVASSPEIAHEILQKKDAFFSGRSILDSLRSGNHHEALMNFLPSTSPTWRRNRAICAINIFSVPSLEKTREIRAQKAQDIIDCFHKKAGQNVHVGEIIFAGMINMISNVLFSQDVVDISSESPQEFAKLIKESINEILKPNISDFFPFLRFLDLQGRRRTSAGYNRRYYKFFDVIIDASLQHRSNGEKQYGDFLDSLLDLYANSKITRREIQILLMVIFLSSYYQVNFFNGVTACKTSHIIMLQNGLSVSATLPV
jgi:cytochrome P450